MKGDRSALLVADVQKDFCAGGALPVPDAERVIAPLNRYIDEAVARGMIIYIVRDWHPAKTTHFKAYGGPWPPHCIQGTDGASFHDDFRLPPSAILITKGDKPDSHGYSAFEGHTADGKPFPDDLRARGIERLYIGGLATDFCVRRSALDALSAGLKVVVLEDAIAGIDASDSARALTEMQARGASIREDHAA